MLHKGAMSSIECPVLLPAASEMRPCAALLAHALPVGCPQEQPSASVDKSASASPDSEAESIAEEEQSSQPSPNGSAEPDAGQRPGTTGSPSPSRDTTAECSQDGADWAKEEGAAAEIQVMPDGSSGL